MILQSKFPPDIRVEKEARSLIEAGHNIYLLSLEINGRAKEEKMNGINIIRVNPSKNLLHVTFGAVPFILSFKDIFWAKAIEDTIQKYNIDIIHVHDLLLVKTALSVANKYKIPVIADLHENYPEAVKAWRKKRNNWKDKLLSIIQPIWRWRRFEKRTLKHVDKIITVVEEAKEHYIKDCDISAEKITVVMNTEDIKKFSELKLDHKLISKYKNNFIISYIGGFGPHRGIDTIIRAMPKILQEISNAKLLLVGGKSSKKFDDEISKLIKELDIKDSIVFTGWVDFKTVPSYIALSDVCLVPHHASGHTNTTIPHKLFQYMAMKKPVVVTDCKPLKRIVEESNSGIVIPSGSHHELAKAIIKLYKNKHYAKELGENGRKTVEEKYNWQSDAKKLIELYTELENERNKKID
jgi:glycosyltransferase involved in cell wall biosynthesis